MAFTWSLSSPKAHPPSGTSDWPHPSFVALGSVWTHWWTSHLPPSHRACSSDLCWAGNGSCDSLAPLLGSDGNAWFALFVTENWYLKALCNLCGAFELGGHEKLCPGWACFCHVQMWQSKLVRNKMMWTQPKSGKREQVAPQTELREWPPGPWLLPKPWFQDLSGLGYLSFLWF